MASRLTLKTSLGRSYCSVVFLVVLCCLLLAACGTAGVSDSANGNGSGNGTDNNSGNVDCPGIGNTCNSSKSQSSMQSLSTEQSSASPEPQPINGQEIADILGGDSNDWLLYGDNGWAYRGGSQTNSFIVPHWCIVDAGSQGRLYPGASVEPQVSLTIYYHVSQFDLKGHNP